MMSTERDPLTDPQPPPAPAPEHAIGAHDRAIASLYDGCDMFSATDHLAAVYLLKQRKQLGIAKYQTVLHRDNGRDNTRDLLEELADAVAYAHNADHRPLIKICEWALLAAVEIVRQDAGIAADEGGD